MLKTISLLLPTRGRPELAKRFMTSVLEHSAHPELIEVIVCVDDDDVTSHGICVEGLQSSEIIVSRQNMGAYNALCLDHSSGDVIIAVNDDMVIRTRDWDQRVREIDARFPDGVYLAYGNDLFKGKDLCTFPIMSKRACQIMTEPFPRAYRGAFIDVHLMDIFQRLRKANHHRIVYCETLVFEHLHYRVIPGVLDKTYTERPRFADDLTFINLAGQRQSESALLIAAIEGNEGTAALQMKTPKHCQSTDFFSVISLCLRRFGLDRKLPVSWRFKLMFWMIARYCYCRLVLRAQYDASCNAP